MRLLKTHPLLGLLNSYMVDSPQPANISYMWNFGSLLGACLGIQIVTGVTLAMHYTPSVDLAFISVEHIMRDVNYGWLIRYLHANTASFFFIFVYLHIGRGLYYGSYKSPRTLVWSIGVIILVLMIIIAFLGYVLPYGQMSLWGATVITNLVSAVPWIGQDIVEFLWGGFSVNNATLNRFYSLHFVLPFALAALVVAHLIALHEHGSGNPLGISGNTDRIPFHPYFTFKDLVTVFAFLLALSALVFYAPNLLGHSDNYIPANPMQTPASIVPEWYLLPFYAILRSIPNKLLGVIAMLAALLILLAMPLLDTSRIRGAQFRPLMRFAFWVLVSDFFLLMYLGACHVEDPFITVGQVCTALYFGWFIVIVPLIGVVENTLLDLATQQPLTETPNRKIILGMPKTWSEFKLDLNHHSLAVNNSWVSKNIVSSILYKSMLILGLVNMAALFIAHNYLPFIGPFFQEHNYLLYISESVSMVFFLLVLIVQLNKIYYFVFYLFTGQWLVFNSPLAAFRASVRGAAAIADMAGATAKVVGGAALTAGAVNYGMEQYTEIEKRLGKTETTFKEIQKSESNAGLSGITDLVSSSTKK